MTITKASELFSQDGRFFPSEPTEEDLNHAVFAPLPTGGIEEEDYAALVEPEGRLGEWWVAVDRRQRAGSLSGSLS
jgi:hypothetical protein